MLIHEKLIKVEGATPQKIELRASLISSQKIEFKIDL